MNKRTIIITIGLLLLVVVVAVGSLAYKNYKASQQTVGNYVKKPVSLSPINPTPIYQMSGKITGVTTNSIMVQGLVGGTNKSIEFIVNPQTAIKKSSITITSAELKSGKQFHPQTVVGTGKFSDLTVNMLINSIISKDNLLNVTQTTASEINLTNYDFPAAPPAK